MRLITFIIFITIIVITLPQAWASDSTPSADIKTKLEELKKEIATRAAKLKIEVSKKLQNKAYTGTIKTKTEKTITLESKSGPKIVKINQDTVFVSEIKTKVKPSLRILKEGDFLATLGDVDETGVLTARKIVLLNPKPQTLNPKTYLWGKIISISDELVTLKDRNLKNIGVSLPTPNNVGLNDFVILTGSKDEKEIFEAEFVYVIPQGGFIRPKKATPSATGY